MAVSPAVWRRSARVVSPALNSAAVGPSAGSGWAKWPGRPRSLSPMWMMTWLTPGTARTSWSMRARRCSPISSVRSRLPEMPALTVQPRFRRRLSCPGKLLSVPGVVAAPSIQESPKATAMRVPAGARTSAPARRGPVANSSGASSTAGDSWLPGGGGRVCAGDGVPGVVGHGGEGGRSGVAGQVEAEGEFLARAHGEFDGVAGRLLAGGDGGGGGAGEAGRGGAPGVDAAAFGAQGEVGAADLQGCGAVAVGQVDADGLAA